MKQEVAAAIPQLHVHTNTVLAGLEQAILQSQVLIEKWFRQQWRATPPLLYSSVDLRNAGIKLAPVDTNLFSAGFNNLPADAMPLAIQAAQTAFEAIMPGCTRILIIPENHTRNLAYFESLATLQTILQKAGFAVRIGTLATEITVPQTIALAAGKTLLLEPVQRVGKRLCVQDFNACFILLNNDLSGGVPAELIDLAQPIYPPLALGWASRLKSVHFAQYAAVATEFAALINIDPWLINPLFRQCTGVNFLKREGEDELIAHATELLAAIKLKYDEYQIQQKPFLVIKADAGTYGMGVISIYAAEELRELNRKRRTQMSVSKGKRPITQVLIQEGVYTIETYQAAVAEPVVYMLGQHVVGGFYRLHAERSATENLNAPGMQFAPLPFAGACNTPEQDAAPTAFANRAYVYGVVARLALMAAAREQQTLKMSRYAN